MEQEEPPHFLVVTFPAQGHLNPAFQFCKNLIRVGGAHVTLLTCVSAARRLTNLSFPAGFSLATFSDGYDDGFTFVPGVDTSHYASEFKRRGSEALTELIVSRRVSSVVYTLLLPWAADVARSFHVPSALLWVQPATVFALYYLYFNGHSEKFDACFEDPSSILELPGLPPMRSHDLPSFLLPSNSYLFIRTSFREQMDALAEESNPTIFINTFEELEPLALKLKALEEGKVKLIPIGPLLPSGYLDEEIIQKSSDTSFGVDLFQGSGGYTQWLDSKLEESVVYVSFGTIAVLSEKQMEEVARGLIDCGRPFLWVVRTDQFDKEEGDRSRHYMEELGHHGMVVTWCSQLEVLSHRSVGCFVTHCGWNSTLESLVLGVPVVAFPQWTDQGTNAKLIEDVWKTGVQVVRDEEGVVEAAEIRRCIDLLMGGSGGAKGPRSNARKWRDLARQAAREGGSSYRNLKDFVDKAIVRFSFD